MGDASARSAAPHPVSVRGFCLDATEVNVADFNRCVAAGACEAAAESVDWAGISPRSVELYSSYCNAPHRDRAQHPINCVDWSQATAYCTWANKRLPTEAEWEAAARHVREGQGAFHAGDGNVCDLDCAEAMQGLGVTMTPLFTSRDGWAGTAPVGSFRRSGQIADLFGNVREWVADWYAPYEPSTAVANDPRGPETARMHVTRGGHWQSRRLTEMEPFARSYALPGDKVHDLGFRCASNLGEAASTASAVGTPVDAGTSDAVATPRSYPDIRGRWEGVMTGERFRAALEIVFIQNLGGGEPGTSDLIWNGCAERPGRCVGGTWVNIDHPDERGTIRAAQFDDANRTILEGFYYLGDRPVGVVSLRFDAGAATFRGDWTQERYGGSDHGAFSGSRVRVRNAPRRRR